MVPGIYEFDNLKGPLKGTASAQILASKEVPIGTSSTHVSTPPGSHYSYHYTKFNLLMVWQ